MKARKIPMRTCVVTRESLPKQELLRVVKDKENNLSVDVTGKANGRGAYLKKDLAVIDKARKTKVLERVLEIEIKEEIYRELEDYIISS